MTAARAPDTNAMRLHLEWLVQPVRETHPDLRFEIAVGTPAPNSGRTFRIDEIDSAIDYAAWANRRGCNCYVGALLKRTSTRAKGRTCAEDAEVATALAVDIDVDLVDTTRKLVTTGCRPQLVVITGTVPQPRGAAWLRLAATTDLSLYDTVNARIVASCGGDRNALGRARLMRLAGSVSFPSPAKAARGYVIELVALRTFNAPTHDLNDLLARLPPVNNIVPFPSPACARAARSRVADDLTRVGYGPLPANVTNLRIVATALATLIDSHCAGYDLWLRTGMALHSLGWGDIGLSLWRQFSLRCPDKFDEAALVRKWASFDNYDGARVTLGWLRREAELHGWVAPARWDLTTPAVRRAAP